VRLDPSGFGQHTMELLAGIGYGANEIEAPRTSEAIA
jgi:hypothetical protein